MTRKLAFSNVTELLRHDEARLAAFGAHSTHGRRDVDGATHRIVPLSPADLGNTFSGYTVKAAIGNPLTTYDLIVDSATAITWVGAGTPYVSLSGVDTEDPVVVNYHYGSFQGTMWNDNMILAEKLIITGMDIGVASTSRGVVADGVLGIGPTSSGPRALTGRTIPTITDRLISQGTIKRPVVSIFFQPITANQVKHGELTFGGTHPSMYKHNIRYTDITTTPPSSNHWGINQSITYGATTILDNSAGILDCGTTFLYLASDAYEKYKDSTGGTVNPANGLLQISPGQFRQLYTLNFYIGESIYKLIPNAQIWPRSLNERIGGGADDIYLVVKDLGTAIGAGLDFINGYVFFQRFYIVFDSSRDQVGFGRTIFTYNISN
ncbi:aspartic peptidase domain-containing protein [Suillus spraguei]|nr:aspartic peptidase domain-containing protein [Suillus spraguei]